jgi:hypothetical protein
LLAEIARSGNEKFAYHHHRYSRVGLTHLCFADDLFIYLFFFLSEDSMRSIVAVYLVLSEFESLSSLKVNPKKQTFFFCACVPTVVNC